jgi:S-adenosylmethionine synthetase
MHVDRFGARKAREMAVEAVKKGAGECLVRAVYAPNVAEPLDVQVEVSGRELGIDRSRLVLSGTARIDRARVPEGGWSSAGAVSATS